MYGDLGGGEEEAIESGREVEVVQEKQEWGGGRERGKEGWERPKPKLWLGRFSTVKPLPLGECCWLVH